MTTAEHMDRTLDIGIVGGSIGGLFCAAVLERLGHRVTVFERSRQGLERRGAGLVAQQEIFDLLHTVGRDRDAEVGVVATERIVFDRAGRIVSSDPTPQIQLSWDRTYLTFRALVPSGHYRLGANVSRVIDGENSAVVQLTTGDSQEFDLVIGADGLGSVVRRTVAPEDVRNHYAGYVTWRGLVPEKALPPEASGALLGRFAFYNGPSVHMLGYLVPGAGGETTQGDRRYNWVWYRSMSEVERSELMRQCGKPTDSFSTAPGDLPAGLRAQLVQEAADVLPAQFAAAVAAEQQPFMQAIYDYVPPRMTGRRVALMGDAAAVVRPHTAMGAAKAAGDALSLASALSQGRGVEAALARYGAERLPVARAISDYGRRLARSLQL